MIRGRLWSNGLEHGCVQMHILLCPICLWDHSAQALTLELCHRLLEDHFTQLHRGLELPSLTDLEEITEGAFNADRRKGP